ncbi:hypothetical protein A3H85_03935 [Candidatus Daviesbacteria bacterium RIFCSPLOWO2_02_FULL_40_8]|uniref:FAD linked oxidase N-terminal domain-containing protein n=1 Tax=Candidatus Daviesbacteria bacterium RIFCSPLOWO2_01_FULL_40_24 TaxID=1797787 RepID=A0A1F5MJ69_9BACT|nr:MAG: hypothetical protein A3C32_04065 [Candidatus Daviesbacteria bacterium RIFCSPHIGHO2_02_FULL_41_14]OGE65402.1 MAG: hypothetical protein A3B49_00760 [Candidatus Daviesbacteria bacterium RIFCSPLOWO2_01_FULL_40_24]OGE65902.1 MAG: hypothetical protein A3H85_03935 [Candidatus Daviesbacteria bacterium RIFCSPLOWO2_02_FULL_40_8]
MDDSKINLLRSELGDTRIKLDVELGEYLQSTKTAKAAALFIVATQLELIKVLDLATELKIPWLLIGAGSKVVLSQTEFAGLVIKNRSSEIRIYSIKGAVSKTGIGIKEAMLQVDSGVNLKKMADYCNKQSLIGFENLMTVPGTIGGSILVNKDLRDKVSQVRVWTTSGIEDKILDRVKRDDIILSVVVKLKRTL